VFLKRKVTSKEIDLTEKYRSKIMKAIMVDDMETDGSMKDINLEDLKSVNINE
jgi:phosphoribosylformimino-5-aminoimidazole carboxamide ribonucleotide (ProFAR) isomerase